MKYLLTIGALFVLISTQAQDIFGKWKTIDDETGEAKSIVEIYEVDGKAYGKIIELFRKPEEDQDPSCKKCPDERNGMKVIGMEIIRDMVLDDDEWEDGNILDPKTGKIYDCKLWLDEDDPNKLQVRGYVAIFFRTQTWLRQ